MQLRVVQSTPKLILEWDPVPGAAAGYRGRAEGVEKWTQTQATRMTFASGATGIVIQALGIEDEGHYPSPPPPPTSPGYVSSSIAAGDTLAGTVSWSVETSGDVAKVEFWANGALFAEDPTGGSPFTCSLDSTLLPEGANELGVAIVGVSGERVTEQLGEVTVDNIAEPPPASAYTWRFATFNPATDKITGCLNRFPPTYSWWVPGSPELGPWPKGGGIKPVSHPTYGPGLDLIVTDEMLYGIAGTTTGPKDSNVVRFVAEPNKIDERLRVPAAGSIHTWECTIMRPAGTWPNGPYECVWEQGTDNGFGSNVGHHIFLNNNAHFPGFSYYFGRQNGAGPLGGTYWQRYNAPVPFNVGEYHTIRWEFKWTAPGVANGYLKTWIGVNGAALTPWLDLQNIATHVAGFRQHYTQMVTIRTPRNVLVHPALSLHVYNMQVKIV